MADENIDFGTVSDESEDEQLKPLSFDDFKGGSYIKNPNVDETISFEIEMVVNNPQTKLKNKTTGKDFEVGLKSSKPGVKTKRYDIHAKEGIYTIANWEIYFKLLGPKGILQDWAKNAAKNKAGFDAKNPYRGAIITITKLLDGGHASMKISDLAKILGKTQEEATAYQEAIKSAIKEQRLYKVEVN
jgi:hypothetical protein